ncbi:unnamed protein product, partial [Arabidopsis halleri]
EFLALRPYLQSNGIAHLTSPPHTPEHNGVSERKYRHIVETGLTLLSTASMPKTYWPYAFATAVYLINRLPTSVLARQTPFFKPFATGRVYVSRHVQFDETQFPFQAPTTRDSSLVQIIETPQVTTSIPVLNLSSSPPAPSLNVPPSLDLHRSPQSASMPPPLPAPSSTVNQPPNNPSTITQVLPSLSALQPSSSSTIIQRPTGEAQAQQTNPSIAPIQRPTGPSHLTNINQSTDQRPTGPSNTQLLTGGTRHPVSPSSTQIIPESLQPHRPNPIPNPNPTPTPNPVINQNPIQNQNQPENTHRMQTRSKNNIQKPSKKYGLLTALRQALAPEPATYKQALKDDRWRHAMSDEINGQLANHT